MASLTLLCDVFVDYGWAGLCRWKVVCHARHRWAPVSCEEAICEFLEQMLCALSEWMCMEKLCQGGNVDGRADQRGWGDGKCVGTEVMRVVVIWVGSVTRGYRRLVGGIGGEVSV